MPSDVSSTAQFAHSFLLCVNTVLGNLAPLPFPTVSFAFDESGYCVGIQQANRRLYSEMNVGIILWFYS